MQDRILYDWVSITSKIHSLADIQEILGMKDCPWQTKKNGAKGFPFGVYYESISIFFGRDDGYVWLDMSGQGCRAFETYGTGDFEALFDLVRDEPEDVHLTRLDVAYDDHTGLLDIDKLADDCRKQNYRSRFEAWMITESNKGCTVEHGSEQSEVKFRIYDKAAERNRVGEHWVRVEMQLRRDRAFSFISSEAPIGEKFAGVLQNYLTYLSPANDSNKRRWPVAPYWEKLVNSAEPISLYIEPGTEYNMMRMANYVFNQAGNAIDATIEILGYDGFMDELRHRTARPNPKYTDLIIKAERGEL